MKAQVKISLLLIICLSVSMKNINAQDTLFVDAGPKLVKKAEPLRATMLAIAFPGLGQIYNKKYWKVPVVYAGFGGIIYAIKVNSSGYNTFIKAYQDFTDNIRETDSYLELIKNADPSTYDPVLHPNTYDPSNAEWYKERMLRQVDYFRKYRDLSYIGIAAWLLVTVLDANVDASLSDFDVSDNLGMTFEPVRMPLYGQSMMGFTVNLKLNF
ncbi:MAG TPA: DUF5683 domain-containing protein [Bacteroidales bacterium]|nr:DUF5683 domain-containing protein [Bacteroidales bacterium]HQB37390.1 DUF5683 domain-containing protein [Bacteroidales bacterium]